MIRLLLQWGGCISDLQVRKRLAAFEARQAIREAIENARKNRKAAAVEDGAPVDPNRPKRAA